jgi:hypothetical protein
LELVESCGGLRSPTYTIRERGVRGSLTLFVDGFFVSSIGREDVVVHEHDDEMDRPVA